MQSTSWKTLGWMKQRHYFANKGLSSQGYGFPVVMYGCESWTIKKAECWRLDAFELWCWRRLLRVTWTARRSNQSILKEISPSKEHPGLISFRMDWLDLLAVQWTLKTLKSSPTPQFKSINYLALSFPYSPTLISAHEWLITLSLFSPSNSPI